MRRATRVVGACQHDRDGQLEQHLNAVAAIDDRGGLRLQLLQHCKEAGLGGRALRSIFSCYTAHISAAVANFTNKVSVLRFDQDDAAELL